MICVDVGLLVVTKVPTQYKMSMTGDTRYGDRERYVGLCFPHHSSVDPVDFCSCPRAVCLCSLRPWSWGTHTNHPVYMAHPV
jgi:hypothetical protein